MDGRAAGRLEGERVVVRPATADDADMLVEWHRDPDVSRFWDEKVFTHEEMIARLARPHVDPYIVESEGAPIGYIQAWFDSEDETGIDMFLLPGHRGRGLGPAAARTLVGHLLTSGRPRVTVDPYASNEAAVRSWRRAGFKPVSEHPADEEHTAAWLLMEFDPAS
jgi:aminoglycoside 6'-N-acetyltransferase